MHTLKSKLGIAVGYIYVTNKLFKNPESVLLNV